MGRSCRLFDKEHWLVAVQKRRRLVRVKDTITHIDKMFSAGETNAGDLHPQFFTGITGSTTEHYPQGDYQDKQVLHFSGPFL